MKWRWFSQGSAILNIDTNKKILEDFNLCIDIGNTRNKAAVFKGDDMQVFYVFEENELNVFLDELSKEFNLTGILVSSTRKKIPDPIKTLGSRSIQYIELSEHIPLPIGIDYTTPETLGRDRIAAAAGAVSLFPGQGIIVIDAGTCVTCDYVDPSATFRGGNISPGMHMRLKAMHEFTANLPLVNLSLPGQILGKSTMEALQNGAMRGTIYEIDSFIRETEKKYGDCRVILTGGDAIYFVDYFKSKIFVVQNLVLIGLNQILKHNA